MAPFAQLLKQKGYTQEDINKFSTPGIASVLPKLGGPLSFEESQALKTKKPDVVFPFKDEANTQVTQLMGENANNPQYNYGPQGHEGVDFANNENPAMTNPIGGINVTGYQPGGYGNWQMVVGSSPEELAQMSPEEKTTIRDTVTQYMLNNPANIRDLNIPGKNISMQAHMAEPAPASAEIATGSADLKMGGSGGWDPHLHSAFKDTNGNMQQIQDMIQKAIKMKMTL